MSRSTNLLLIGMADVGKTHYGAQVWLRLDADTSGMELLRSGDITPFLRTIESLSDGQLGERTSKTGETQSSWRIRRKSDGMVFDLEWPDYAGETLQDLLDERRMSADWLDRIEAAEGWALMIRASHIRTAYDIFSRKPSVERDKDASPDENLALSLQSRLVEVLQMFLYRHALTRPNAVPPPLVIIISCFDELPEGTIADEFLAEKMPLLYSFAKRNWTQNSWRVYGLSPLGKPLEKGKADAEFIKSGPENMGFVVDDTGYISKDLLLPLEWLTEQVSD